MVALGSFIRVQQVEPVQVRPEASVARQHLSEVVGHLTALPGHPRIQLADYFVCPPALAAAVSLILPLGDQVPP